MKKNIALFLCFLLSCMLSTLAFGQCTTIKSGQITNAAGVIKTGFDKWGYNYQAHMFNGLYDNYSRPTVPFTTGDINLVMKWSDEWISNQDCNGDGKLDRGLDSKTGVSDGISKGWCTNHFEGDYEDAGVMYHYTEEIKMVYVGPAPAGDDPWGGDVSIGGKRIWVFYAVVEDVINDNHGGFHGVQKNLLANPAGLGYYTN